MMTRMDAGLIANARVRPDDRAVTTSAGTLTYAELNDRARRAAHALQAAGVERAGTVAVMLPNGAPFFEAVHAAGRLRAVVVPVNTHFKADEVGWIVRDSGAQAVVTTAEYLPALDQVADVPRLLVEDGWPEAGGEIGDPDDGWPTLMAYTSGTTGRPKGVAIGQDDFRRHAAGVAASGERWNLGPDDVHLLVGPLYHSGPSYWGQMHLAFGGEVVIMEQWDAEEALALVERYGVTNTHMVPANFQRILALPEATRDRFDLSSLRLVVHAAAPCPVPLKRAFMDFVGAEKVWEYYGASEGGGTVISPDEWLAHPGSVGKPFPGNEFAILDDDGTVLPPGEVGTVYAKPAGSSFEYHNDAEKTATAHRDGFFTVGDAGYLDADGYLYLTDRTSDMVISGGVNIYPREIEECLFANPEVVDCAVLGVPDAEWGEVLYAVVQPTAGSTLNEDAVVGWVRDHLADYKRPRVVELVDVLPRDPNGKVRKPKLRDAYLTRIASQQ